MIHVLSPHGCPTRHGHGWIGSDLGSCSTVNFLLTGRGRESFVFFWGGGDRDRGGFPMTRALVHFVCLRVHVRVEGSSRGEPRFDRFPEYPYRYVRYWHAILILEPERHSSRRERGSWVLGLGSFSSCWIVSGRGDERTHAREEKKRERDEKKRKEQGGTKVRNSCSTGAEPWPRVERVPCLLLPISLLFLGHWAREGWCVVYHIHSCIITGNHSAKRGNPGHELRYSTALVEYRYSSTVRHPSKINGHGKAP
ncbi:unnamed protein product [Tuber aestivum]|uniref:Uncharacterized protein n=1 Tax=Tuber aestivum TaxID=59557 RepID=A0A292PK25_9PEZI|nr:unnamed protein product [Tuber aestivum]